MSESSWTLHAQLAADTTAVGELALSRVLAVNAADYPWLILVPRRAGASEIADLGADAFPLMAEIALVSLMLKEVTQCDKINVAALGNMVCRSCISTSSPAARPIRCGRSRCSAHKGRAPPTRKPLRASSPPCARSSARRRWVERSRTDCCIAASHFWLTTCDRFAPIPRRLIGGRGGAVLLGKHRGSPHR